MNSSDIPERPRLRMVDSTWVQHQGQNFLHLRDPLGITDATIMVPEPVATVLAFTDGNRTLPEIRSALALRVGLSLTIDDLQNIIGQLDQALMIENGAYQPVRRRALNEFRAAEYRPLSHAGPVYPRSASAVEAQIDAWCAEVNGHKSWKRPDGDLVGMVCPHIDYSRGHATYAELWTRVEAELSEIELVIILGTDHYGGPARLTPTRQSYATPYGTLSTDQKVAASLEDALGRSAYDEELHHTSEHSIELAAIWLHHFLRGGKVPVAPVLCGSFHGFVNGESRPEDDARLTAALDVLSEASHRCRTLVIAAGDLAHVGPAFGDRQPLDAVAKARLTAEDSTSLEAIDSGNADAFLEVSRSESDRRRICGLPPIYLMLKLVEGASGISMAYSQCPADVANTSVVSIAGTLLYR
jgi:AmmeMemoRadiSam system protein B